MGSKECSDEVTLIINQGDLLGCFVAGHVDVKRAIEICASWLLEQTSLEEEPYVEYALQGYLRQEIDKDGDEVPVFYNYRPQSGDKNSVDCTSQVKLVTIVGYSTLLPVVGFFM